jgi:hypothetical protein
MPPPSPNGSPLPTASPPEASSHRPPSPVYEHGRPSEGILVVDLSSEEEDAFLNTLRDEEFARKLFSDLNHGLLGRPGDDNTDAKAEVTPSSTINSSAPTVSVTADDDAPDQVPDDSNDGEDEVSMP